MFFNWRDLESLVRFKKNYLTNFDVSTLQTEKERLKVKFSLMRYLRYLALIDTKKIDPS